LSVVNFCHVLSKTTNDFFKRIEETLINSNQDFLNLEYKTCLNDQNKNQIMSYLQVHNDLSLLKITWKKLDKRNLSERIKNFEEVKSSLIGTKYESFLNPQIIEYKND